MKILQINTVCGYGSTGRIAVDLYHVLEKNGHECVIAYGRGNAPKDINTIKIGTNKDVYWHVLITRILDKHGYGSKRATKRLIEQIKKYNPDIIHLHNIHGYYINLKILFDYIKKYNKRVVWTLHDCWAFTGHCSHFDYINCNKWQNECSKCTQLKEYPSSLWRDNSSKNYKLKKQLFSGCKNLTIVVPSKWLENKVKSSYLNYPVEVIYNGIDLQKFKKKESNLKRKYSIEDKFIILGVANQWGERKGLNYFIKLANMLDEKFQIILVGIDKKTKKRLPENIIAINRTNSLDELAEYYSIADIFVNPTLEETFSLVNVEAMACGTPVITFNTGGSPESLNNNTGIVVEKSNLELLAETIKKFNKDRFYGFEEQVKKFERDSQYNKYIKLYERIMK